MREKLQIFNNKKLSVAGAFDPDAPPPLRSASVPICHGLHLKPGNNIEMDQTRNAFKSSQRFLTAQPLLYLACRGVPDGRMLIAGYPSPSPDLGDILCTF